MRLIRAVFLLAACGLIAAGCDGVAIYGKADNYDFSSKEKIPVVMPPNAPYISQQFNMGGEYRDKKHPGIDVWGKLGTPVIAAAPGRVTQSFYEPAYGNRIVIDHGGDAQGARVSTVYKHLKTRLAEAGDTVARGQQIGTMGATGALGMMVHLHFEVRRDLPQTGDVPEDPHLTWVDGPGRVTCFDRNKSYPDRPFRTTYPVPCRGM